MGAADAPKVSSADKIPDPLPAPPRAPAPVSPPELVSEKSFWDQGFDCGFGHGKPFNGN